MKKITPILLIFTLCLCSCKGSTNSETRFLLDTVATITANCSDETLDGAFELCKDYENLLSRTKEESTVFKLNNSSGFKEIDNETLKIIERSLYYSRLSDGKFDITIMPVSILWDFKNEIIPTKDEISEALKNVDYEAIEINGNLLNLNGKKIDLGSIAKGYIADKVKEYLISCGATNGIVNLGGNVVVFGKEYKVGIMRPFSEDAVATLSISDKSVVTSGIYQRYIKKDGAIYHHIIDTKTGYAVDNELASVTIIADSSMDCDALSTVCMLVGTKKATEIIEKTPDTEAVFVDRNGNLTFTDGIYKKENLLYLK